MSVRALKHCGEKWFGSNLAYRSRKAVSGANRDGFLEGNCADAYFAILYVRSPSALLEDSMFKPPLLPRMLMKPRTV